MNEKGLERLRFAVVLLAAQDYLNALKMVHKQHGNKYHLSYAEYTIKECERFFKDDCSAFVDVDGMKFMDTIWRNSWDEHYRIKG